MFGKIVQLRGKEAQAGYEVVYGIKDCITLNRYSLSFGEIVLGNNIPNGTATYIHGGHIAKEYGEGYQKVMIFNGVLPKDGIEEYLLVIIPYASQLKTDSKRVAGRYYYEAILEMHNGDTVEVSKNSAGKREVYMAVQAGNEMFLIKKER